MESPRWHTCRSAAEVRERAAAWIAEAAQRAVEARGVFRIVLAGGETPRGVYRALRGLDIDWNAWRIWFGDERCLAADDPLRNSRMAGEALLDHVPVPPCQVHAMHAELGATRAAAAYCATLTGEPEFDLVLLGLGEDGHTASLFPGGEWGEAPDAPDVLAVRDAPKPPAERVSLGARRLGRTRCALFLVAGASKRAAVAAWRSGARLPAAAVRPPAGVDVLLENICIEG
ncbi:MAG: 6-phosphogluconolactonase [Gammaproteobacteria bacterium]|nr:6-phosphogluconolactonase [Gammaproteobacteria bacterium]